MAWKNVQRNTETGQYRTHDESGGASALTDLTDVNVSSPSDGQVLKYDSTTQKWKNEDESGGGGTVTDVKVDGQSVVNPQTGEAEITMPSVPVQDVQVDGTSVVNQQGVAEITMPTPPTPDYPVTDVKVNGTSVVSNKQALITSYKEVTQSEYENLPASKLTDGVAYFIKDATEAEGFPPLIYSTNEREVGVWTDGKPLYQRTFHITTIPNSNMVDVPHGISNIDRIVDIKGILHAKLSVDSANAFTPIPRIQDNQTNQNLGIDVNNTNIRLKARGYDLSYVYEYADVTLQYTKTTDTAGSGIWDGNGAMAHHYSTNEVIVGTWIDGKPLYEKTVYLSSISYDTNWHSVAHNISNLKRVIDFCGIGMNGDGECFLTNSYRPSLTQGIIITITETNIRYMNNWQDDNSLTAYVTIRYTKTTD